MAAVSGSDAWAVGSLIEHWNGTFWAVVPSPSPSADQDVLEGVAALSASYAWAVGYQGRYRTLIERWNGFSWKVQPSPN